MRPRVRLFRLNIILLTMSILPGLVLLCFVRCSSAFTPPSSTIVVIVGGPIAAPRMIARRPMPSARRASSSPSADPRDGGDDGVDDDDVFPIHRRELDRREFVLRSSAAFSATAGSIVASTTLQGIDSASAADDVGDATYIDPSMRLPVITHRAYLDVEFGNKGGRTRLIVGLFGKDMERTVNNFLALCSGGGGDDSSDGPTTYAGSTFYRGSFRVFFSLTFLHHAS